MNDNKNPLKLAVFATGRGSNLESIINHIKQDKLNAQVELVISNKSTAGALELARTNNIPALHISQIQFADQARFCEHLAAVLQQHHVDMIILAGYMKKVPPEIIRAYKNRILNIHPALLPSFGGQGLYGIHVHKAVLEYGCRISGATVHLVDEDYDTGPPVCQESVPVYSTDTPEVLAARVLEVEHKIFPKAIQLFAENRVKVEGRRIIISEPEKNNC